MISGFTIFNQLFNTKISAKKFILTRFTRISVVYYPMLIFAWYFLTNTSIENLLLHLLYLENINSHFFNSIIGVEWSLSIEMFYYFIFAIFIKIGIIDKKIKSTLLLTILFLFLPYVYNMLNTNYPNIKDFFFFLPHGYLFFFGGLSFHFKREYQKIVSRRKVEFFSRITLLLSLIAFSAIIKQHSNFSHELTQLFTGFTTAMIIIFCVDEKNWLNCRLLVFLGSISYSLYLCHSFGFNIARKFVAKFSFDLAGSTIFFGFVFSVFLATISYFILEKFLYIKLKNLIKKSNEADFIKV